jgi:hypothetical protein
VPLLAWREAGLGREYFGAQRSLISASRLTEKAELMRITTPILCLLQVAGAASPASSYAQIQRHNLVFADTGEAGGSGSSEGIAKDHTRTATAATNDFASGFNAHNHLEEQEFIARFNNLMKALREFGSAYKPGQVIDFKKAKAVRKAMQSLEKSGWFRPQKDD